jgi:predicted nuclease of restriction endonuclease-like (RecB) superfamily
MLHVDRRTRNRWRLPIASAAIVASLLAICYSARATCRCGSGSTEVCIVLDTTSSMDLMIGTVKEQLYRVLAALEGSAERLRVGAVVYRTAEGPEYVVRKVDLSEDRKPLTEFIRDAKAVGGGFEAVGEGLEAAINGMSWTKGARKLIILVGDEGPEQGKPDVDQAIDERCRALSRLAKSRGIAVSAITCSDTAWRYWQLSHSDEWQIRKRDLGEARAKEEFQLPIFQEIAKEGGGLAVPSKDTKELLKWLLVIASGASDMTKEEVKKFLEWEPAAGAKAAGRAPMLAQLRYSGEWTTARNFEALRTALGQKVRLDFDSAVEVVAAEDRELAGRPLVYLTGHGEIKLGAAEKTALKRYLELGGLLWADACCGRAEFDASLRKLVGELFPDNKLAPLGADHAIYRSGYAVRQTPHRWHDLRRQASAPGGRHARQGAGGGLLPGFAGLRLGRVSAGQALRAGRRGCAEAIHQHSALRADGGAVDCAPLENWLGATEYLYGISAKKAWRCAHEEIRGDCPQGESRGSSVSARDLLESVRGMIMSARQDVARHVDSVLVALYWNVGRRIREDILHEKRAEYGEGIVPALGAQLEAEFGRGFGKRNLFRMIRFAEVFPDFEIVSALRTQLGWTHFRQLIALDEALKRDFYAEMCRVECWSTRTLEKKIQSCLFERTALSRKPDKLIEQEVRALRAEDKLTPDLVFRDPYILDFLGLKDTYGEKDVEAAILREMEAFILELGVGFAFLERQKRIIMDGDDYYLDLLFYHRRLRRLVAIELKLGDFKPADKGQMEFYLRWLAQHERRAGEERPIGLILCAGKKEETVRLLDMEGSGIRVASYWTDVLPKAELERKLHQAVVLAREKLRLAGEGPRLPSGRTE